MSLTPTTNDTIGFDDFDNLPSRLIGPARLVIGRAFDKASAKNHPILFVHGGYHGAWCYAAWLQDLDRRGIPAAAVDIRGHGGLPLSSDFIHAGVRDYADDVVAAIRHMPAPPILCGHSLGGLVAPLAAMEVDIAGLVLLAPSPPGQLPGAQKVSTVPSTELIATPSVDIARGKFYPRCSEDEISAFCARLTPESPTVLNDRYELRVPVDASAVNAPALCISCGLDDHLLHPDGQDEAVARFYNAEYIFLPEASHCLMLDPDWRTGLEVILDWRQRISYIRTPDNQS